MDQAQWLVDGDTATSALLSAQAWSTRVPAEAFRRITGEEGFPRGSALVDGDSLSFDATPSSCTGSVASPRAATRFLAVTGWEMPPQRRSRTRADIHLSRAPARATAAEYPSSLAPPLKSCARYAPRSRHGRRSFLVSRLGHRFDRYEVTVPPRSTGPRDTFPGSSTNSWVVDDHRWLTALAERTLAKYAARRAAAKTNAEDATLSARREP